MTSYIGVMIDDLTTKGVSEPYRMFTSRAEFRLSLRADNADQRLTEFGQSLGCVSAQRWTAYARKAEAIAHVRGMLASATFSARQIASLGVNINPDKNSRTGLEALALTDFGFDELSKLDATFADVPRHIADQVKRDALYMTYVDRQARDIALMGRDENLRIPPDMEFRNIAGLSTELALKLTKARPETIAQASKIDGMTPSALMLLAIRVRRPSITRSAS